MSEANAIHNALLADGERVVEDFIVGFSHGYRFSCGCLRVYSVNPVRLTDSEALDPCPQHKELKP